MFDHVRPDDADELAMYFIENVTESGDTVALPMPFRLSIPDADGIDHPVDIIPTGRVERDGQWRWTVMIVPVSLNGSIIRSLDLEMAGAPRDEVRRMLCEELLVDNDNYTSRWVLIDLEDPEAPTTITSRADDADAVAAAVYSDVVELDWTPWHGMVEGQTSAIDVSKLAPATRAVMDARGWTRTIVAPVYVRNRLVAAFLLLGRVPLEYPGRLREGERGGSDPDAREGHSAAVRTLGGPGPTRVRSVDRRVDRAQEPACAAGRTRRRTP